MIASDPATFPAHKCKTNRLCGLLLVGILIGAAGCPGKQQEPPAPAPPRPAQPLRVLVVDDAGLAAAVERQWRARAEAEIQVVQATSAELIAAERIAADAVIYPSGLLGELAERRLISPIPEAEMSSPIFERRDIFDLIRQREIVWGRHVYAVPLGSPAFTLMYRRDIFDALGLKPPVSWEEYQALAERLSDRRLLGDLEADASDWSPVVEPLGPGWASQVLLARAASYARHRNYFSTLFDAQTMAPLIDGPPFVRALQELAAVAAQAPAEVLEYGPEEARRELLAGRCAMCLSWPSASDEQDASPDTAVVPLGFAELPGSWMVYNPSNRQWQRRESAEGRHATLLGIAGRLGSVSAATRQPQAALSLLINLSSKEWSEQISPYSPATTLYRHSQLGAVQSWMGREVDTGAAREYGEAVEQMQRRSLWLSLRIPGRRRYLAALDEAVQQVVRGEAEPAEALAAAARQWEQITSERGVDSQRAAYWRSQGIEP